MQSEVAAAGRHVDGACAGVSSLFHALAVSGPQLASQPMDLELTEQA
jgi:hypothetical protein